MKKGSKNTPGSSSRKQEQTPPPAVVLKPKGKPRGKPFPPGVSGNPTTKFPPGVSGNPGGVPKSMKAIREENMARVPMILTKLYTLSLNGSGNVAVQACDKFLDRIVGKAPQPITGEDLGPVKITQDIVMAKLNALMGEPDDAAKPEPELEPEPEPQEQPAEGPAEGAVDGSDDDDSGGTAPTD